MPLTTAETPSSAPAQPMPMLHAGANEDARSAATDFLQIESIVLNLDASLRVYSRAHFFSWTQGLLQSLIRHELLICVLCQAKPPTLRADAFSVNAPDPSTISDLFLRDTAVAPALLKAWEEHRYQPMIFDTNSGLLAAGAFTWELERVGASQLLVHGLHDADGRALSLFAFACRPGSMAARQAYFAHLIVPSLHAAWVRTQLQRRTEGGAGDKTVGQNPLTAREQDILKWVYLGKSNFEIGAILKISPLTVKNHVQKLLRKLNVVNRTQAVGKAMELGILNR